MPGSAKRKSSKTAAAAANSDKTSGDAGPSRKNENVKTTPQCVLCPTHPATAAAYASHLDREHKSTLNKNDIYLICKCGHEVRSDYRRDPKHKGCRLESFTLECALCKSMPHPTPQCVATKCKRVGQANRRHPADPEENEGTDGEDEAAAMDEEEEEDDDQYEVIDGEEVNEEDEDEEEEEEADDDDEQENAPAYRAEGFHPVKKGQVYKQYKVIGKLGYGMSSTVWKCRDMKKRLAKIALKITTANCTKRESAEIEIEMLNRVRDGKKVVQLLDSFSISGVNGTHICMVLELFDSDLFKLIGRPGNIAVEDVRIITRQMLEGLEHMHKCKIIHTDIKPDNVFVKMEGDEIKEVKIGDLGNAYFTNEVSIGQKIQSRRYRSLEVLIHAKFDTTADVWSAACVAFELATGEFLFDPEGDEEDQEDGWNEATNNHIALITQTLGTIPSEVYEKGSRWDKYFDQNGELLHNTALKPCSLSSCVGVLKKRTRDRWNRNDVSAFSSLLAAMLELDPDNRITAAQCVNDEWLRSTPGLSPAP